jgi:hypothetical protein
LSGSTSKNPPTVCLCFNQRHSTYEGSVFPVLWCSSHWP